MTRPDNFDALTQKASSGDIGIKFIFGGEVYKFKTSLDRVVDDPLPLLVLDYPEDLLKEERRSIKRRKCFVPVNSVLEDCRKDGIIRDISDEGCRCNFFISGDETIKMENMKDIKLNCKFSSLGGEREMVGEVKNYQMHGHILSVGILFQDLAENSKKVLNDYILSL